MNGSPVVIGPIDGEPELIAASNGFTVLRGMWSEPTPRQSNAGSANANCPRSSSSCTDMSAANRVRERVPRSNSSKMLRRSPAARIVLAAASGFSGAVLVAVVSARTGRQSYRHAARAGEYTRPEMPKRVDKNDSTMDISASQLVPSGTKRPPVPHQPGVDKNDVSMWIGGVVGADDFAGAKKGAPKPRRALPIVLGLVLLAAAGAGAYYFLFARSTESPSNTPAALPAGSAAIGSAAIGSAEGSGSASGSAVPTPGAPAAVATAPADAAVETPAVGDGGVAGAMALNADAVSAADPKVKPATKKKVTKKKKAVVKKKPATRRK